jgi:hypothetical protein
MDIKLRFGLVAVVDLFLSSDYFAALMGLPAPWPSLGFKRAPVNGGEKVRHGSGGISLWIESVQGIRPQANTSHLGTLDHQRDS